MFGLLGGSVVADRTLQRRPDVLLSRSLRPQAAHLAPEFRAHELGELLALAVPEHRGSYAGLDLLTGAAASHDVGLVGPQLVAVHLCGLRRIAVRPLSSSTLSHSGSAGGESRRTRPARRGRR